MIEKQEIWQSTKGSDAGKLFLICDYTSNHANETADITCHYLVDGRKYRWGKNPKRKNMRHCRQVGVLELNSEEQLKWEEANNMEMCRRVNAGIRRILKRAKGEFNV